ncbi:MAG: ribonuclease R [Planctomycetaceae bacterium]|nr:ribonuclease R [Planctomycetaceae bacterium]
MPQRYYDAILKFLSRRDYHPLKPRQLAHQMGVADVEYDAFREAIKTLRDDGRLVLGSGSALTLPAITDRVVGIFRANRRGFGFVIPDTPNAHGDLYVPAEAVGTARSGDRVVATAQRRGKRDGQAVYQGQIVEIVSRGRNRYVGTLEFSEGAWFVMPEGKETTPPIVVRDVGTAGPPKGTKVLVEIVNFGGPGEFPTGVIVENLGATGQIEAETIGIIRASGIEDVFDDDALADARRAVDTFDPRPDGREDLSGQTVITIDPPDARDYDDAISLERQGRHWILGVHIADVSHFVREGTALDDSARRRGTSVYFPNRVVPMLPEILSNGVCSLQEGQPRFCKSAFITYDEDGNVAGARLAETLIRSTQRLTYLQAQDIIDGKTGGYAKPVITLVQQAAELARKIEQRRREAGMLHLDLPEVRIVLDEQGRLADVAEADTAYTHTVIEMFMVAANEAVAAVLDGREYDFLRRVHPAPDTPDNQQLVRFVRACGHKIPADMDRHAIQALLESVRGTPAGYAVNFAVLRMMQQARYSPQRVGHYALASEDYCHFTSPIRRYPDLTVHRLFAQYCRSGKGKPAEKVDMTELVTLGDHCSMTERRAQAAEDELRQVLVLQFLADKVGQKYEGVVTGVTNFGLFVQLHPFATEGLIRMDSLGDDWWDVSLQFGTIRGQRSGKQYRIGDPITVQIAGVDPARRQLDLAPVAGANKPPKPRKAKDAAGKQFGAGKKNRRPGQKNRRKKK